MIDGINTAPMISLPALVIGLIVVLLAAKAGVEIYVYYSEQKKSPQDRDNDRADRRTTNEAVRRYYTEKRSA